MSTTKTAFSLMRDVYENFRGANRRPCKNPSITNQCAVRMSLALYRSGFTFEDFPNQRRIHQGRTACQLGDEPHLVGANELHSYLLQVWEPGLRGTGSSIVSQIQGQLGILYFNNCFHRSSDPEGTNRGDHIDLWNGSQIYNDVLSVGDDGRTSNLFSRADFVRFFRL